MKNKLLALIALCGATSSTMPLWAAWEDPQLSFVTPDLEAIQNGTPATYYVYHVASGQFMSAGATYGTTFIVASDGQEVTISYGKDYQLNSKDVTDAQYSDAESYRLSMMNAHSNGGFHEIFLDAGGNCYVDHDQQGHILWDIMPQADGTYRICINAEDPTYGVETSTGTTLIGVNKTSDGAFDQVIKPLIVEGSAGYEDATFDWKFVEPAVYERYRAKQLLQEQLEIADERGFTDYADYAALYNSETATPEEINKAVEDLKADLIDFGFSVATETNPIDVTERFVSEPSFDGGMGNWQTVTPAGASYQRKTGDRFENGAGSLPEGKALENFYECATNSTSFMPNWSVTQKLTGLPDGKYRLGAWILTNRLPTEDEPNSKGLFLSATSLAGTVRVEATDPAEEANQNRGYGTWHHYTVDFEVIAGTATIGYVVEGANSTWSAVDDFTLEYLGGSASTDVREAAKATIASIEENYTDNVATAAKSAEVDAAYQAVMATAKEAVENMEVTNDSLSNLIISLQSSYDALTSSVAEYQTLNTRIQDMWAVWDNNEAYVNLDLPEYEEYLGGLEEQHDAGTFDMAQLDSIQPRGNALWKKVIADALVNGDTDNVTGMLTNPNYDASTTDGWTLSGDGSFGAQSAVCEVWNGRNWEVYQEITGLPQGSYKITAQAYYSPSSGNTNSWHENYGMEGDETNNIHGFLFGNDASTPLVHVMSCPTPELPTTGGFEEITWGSESTMGQYLPHDRTAAQVVFEADPNNYLNEVICYVGEDGVLRIGTKMSDVSWDQAWVVFDNFQVTYLGADDMTGATSALNALIQEATTLLSAESLTTTETRDSLSMAIEAATAAAGAELTAEIYAEQVEALQKAMENERAAVSEATALEAKVLSENNKLMLEGEGTYTELYGDTEGYEELENVVLEVIDIIDEQAIFASREAIKNYSDAINAACAKMMSSFYDYSAATKDAPVDVTNLIFNPSFQLTTMGDDGTATQSQSTDGWTIEGGGGATGGLNFEVYNDSTDIHQTLKGLPAGYYRLVFNGFYRAGDVTPAALTRRDSTEIQNAEVYLKSGQNQWTEKLHSIFDEVYEGPKYSGNDVFVADTLLPDMSDMVYRLIVNDVTGAQAAFEDGRYESSFSFQVAEGEEPVLGMRKMPKIKNDWTCIDNFRLYYLGAGDENRPDDIEDSIEDVAAEGTATVVSSTWTTLNGMKVAEPKQRGIYIRIDKMSDGTTRAMKVLVK